MTSDFFNFGGEPMEQCALLCRGHLKGKAEGSLPLGGHRVQHLRKQLENTACALFFVSRFYFKPSPLF